MFACETISPDGDTTNTFFKMHISPCIPTRAVYRRVYGARLSRGGPAAQVFTPLFPSGLCIPGRRSSSSSSPCFSHDCDTSIIFFTVFGITCIIIRVCNIFYFFFFPPFYYYGENCIIFYFFHYYYIFTIYIVPYHNNCLCGCTSSRTFFAQFFRDCRAPEKYILKLLR